MGLSPGLEMCRYLDLWPCGPEDRLHLERLLGWKAPAMPARPATPPPAARPPPAAAPPGAQPPKGRPQPQVSSLPADCAGPCSSGCCGCFVKVPCTGMQAAGAFLALAAQ